MGPPCGGSGGKGGDVYIKASKRITCFGALTNRYTALNGETGKGWQKHGANGKDLEIIVPVGTVVKQKGFIQEEIENETVMDVIQRHFKFKKDYTPLEDRIKILLDRIPLSNPPPKSLEFELMKDGQRVLIAKGGLGGLGNPHFVCPTIPSPPIASKGTLGHSIQLELELKTIADIGLVGLPNAGKSSLLAAISEAHPKIAPYPFTTLNPYIGTIDYKDSFQIKVADIPGLIHGAHKNVGLGHRFLRHVERSKMLVYVIDLASPEPWNDLKILENELESYLNGLTNRPSLIVANKADLGSLPLENLEKLKSKTQLPLIPVSAKEKKNIYTLTNAIRKLMKENF